VLQIGKAKDLSAISYRFRHTLQITTTTAKPFPARYVFTSRFLATALRVEVLQLPAVTSVLSLTLVEDCLSAISSGTVNRNYLLQLPTPETLNYLRLQSFN
jgi:hypothetical protein